VQIDIFQPSNRLFPFPTQLTTGGRGGCVEVSTNSLFELHILLMDMPWTPQILVFNYTFGFMNSTKVLVSTLRISPGLGPNGQAADIATELS